MRILEAITPSRIGGAEVHVTALARALAARGDTARVFCPAGRPFLAYLEEHGITPLSWPTTGKVDPVTTLRLADALRGEGCDLLHTHLSTASFLGGLAARMAGVPCVATVHGFTSALWYRTAHRLIAVSAAVKAYMVEQGLPAERIRVVHNGVALERYFPLAAAAAKRALGLDPAWPVAGIIGRLAPEKGQALAIAGWPRVLAKAPAARLLLVGDGEDALTLSDQVEARGLGDRVIFAGFQADPLPYFAASDIVLMPSRKEGLGLAAIEAMALERPVLAARVGGLPEVVADGETGLLLPGDPDSFADATLALVADPARRAAMGRAGRARVAAHFHAETQFALLREVLADAANAA